MKYQDRDSVFAYQSITDQFICGMSDCDNSLGGQNVICLEDGFFYDRGTCSTTKTFKCEDGARLCDVMRCSDLPAELCLIETTLYNQGVSLLNPDDDSVVDVCYYDAFYQGCVAIDSTEVPEEVTTKSGSPTPGGGFAIVLGIIILYCV